MTTFIRYIDALNDKLGKLISVLLIPMIVIVIYTAVQRYFFHTSVSWGFELALFAFGIHGIVGGAYTLRHDGHVNVDILSARVSPRGRKIIKISGQIVLICVCLVMIYLGSRWAWRSTLIMERSIHATEFNPYVFWYKWMIPLSGLLMVLQAVANILKALLEKDQAGSE